jgi:hypothetical protein
MISAERMSWTLNHRSPDRVAVDFGSTAVTGMHVTCVAELRDYYGLERRPVKVCEPYQMLGEIEDDLLDALGVDTVALPAAGTIFGFRNENWREIVTPWGQQLLVSEPFQTTEDANGDLLIYPQGDMNAPPSGRMPTGGFFFDSIVRQEPIDDDRLNPVQCSAAGMDPATLKERYGDHIVFWGGGVDTQKTLPFGTAEQVRREVLKRCEIFAPNGGFVFNAIHNVQARTPSENIVAMMDDVREYNGC